MGWIIVIAIVGICVIFTYSLCKVSRNSDEYDEKWYQYFVHNHEKTCDESTILSDLEKESIEKLSTDISNLFVPNKKDNITVGECLYELDYRNRRAFLSNGKVIGFGISK
jgi:hypothetical protein